MYLMYYEINIPELTQYLQLFIYAYKLMFSCCICTYMPIHGIYQSVTSCITIKCVE